MGTSQAIPRPFIHPLIAPGASSRAAASTIAPAATGKRRETRPPAAISSAPAITGARPKKNGSTIPTIRPSPSNTNASRRIGR